MRPFTPLLAALLLPLVASAAGLDSEVDRILAGKLTPDGPGVAILVTQDGQPILKRTTGLADLPSSRPITNQTRFDLASVAKPFTALGVLTLVESGRIGLDDALTTILPDFRVSSPGRAITVRDLLQHTSGLSDYTEDYPGNDRVFAAITTETHLEWLNTTRSKTAPGRRFEYNNSNYALLALIAERVSGQTFARFMKRAIFRPARMRGTFIYDGTRRLPSSAASGYIVRRSSVRPSVLLTDITGDGNVYTSINDLAAFLSALQRGRILKPETLALAWTNGQLDGGRPIRDQGTGYGLGWEISASQRSHTGGWAGTSTYLNIDTTTGIAVVVLSNDENLDTYGIGERIRAAASR